MSDRTYAHERLRQIVTSIETDLRLRKNPGDGHYQFPGDEFTALAQDANGRYLLLDAYTALVMAESAQKIAEVQS